MRRQRRTRSRPLGRTALARPLHTSPHVSNLTAALLALPEPRASRHHCRVPTRPAPPRPRQHIAHPAPRRSGAERHPLGPLTRQRAVRMRRAAGATVAGVALALVAAALAPLAAAQQITPFQGRHEPLPGNTTVFVTAIIDRMISGCQWSRSGSFGAGAPGRGARYNARRAGAEPERGPPPPRPLGCTHPQTLMMPSTSLRWCCGSC